MLKGRKVTAAGLILMMLFSVIVPVAFAAPSGVATTQQQATAQQMVEKFKAYYEPFSTQEKAAIQSSYDALKSLSNAQWKTLVDESGLKTAELIAKYDTAAEAEAALTELLKDTYQILYAVYDDDVLYDACLEFVVDEAATVQHIFDGIVTQNMLVTLISDLEQTLAEHEIVGSISDQASDYWNVVYGTGKNYICAVDNVIEQAVEETIENSVLKTKMAALKWTAASFVDLHEKLVALVDSDFQANTLMYDSVLRKHSVLTNVTTGNQVSNGQSFTLAPGKSITMKFTIFGKNVSVPFGSYIKLPEDGSLTITTNQSAGTFQITASKEASSYELVIRRGVIGSDQLVNSANILKTFSITCQQATSQAPVVSNVEIEGTGISGQVLTASYEYEGYGFEEGITTFAWYVQRNGEYQLVSDHNSSTYTPSAEDRGNKIKVKVTPANVEGVIGDPVESTPITCIRPYASQILTASISGNTLTIQNSDSQEISVTVAQVEYLANEVVKQMQSVSTQKKTISAHGNETLVIDPQKTIIVYCSDNLEPIVIP